MFVSYINAKDAVTESNILGYLYTNNYTLYPIFIKKKKPDRPLGINANVADLP